MDMYFEVLKTAFLPYIKNIQDFHFYYDNPLFWAGFMVLYLILDRAAAWSVGKAFFFCAIISSILLGATWLEKPLVDLFTIQEHTGFDPFILKVATVTVISVVVMYFVFVDNS